MRSNLLFNATLLTFLTAASLLQAQVSFSEVVPSPFTGVTESSMATADVDLDGDVDVVIAGRLSGSTHFTRLYLNVGPGSFTSGTAALAGASNSSVAFADIENDGDMDLLVTGQSSGSPLIIISKFYQNDGWGGYSPINGTSVSPVQNSAVAFADVDGNNTPDLIVSGDGGGSNYILELYNCDPMGNFSLSANTFPFGLRYSDVVFFDADNDNDQDLLVTGLAFTNPGTEYKAVLFLNDSTGQFSQDPNSNFTGVAYGSAVVGDINQDGFKDVFISGGSAGSGKTATLYLNNGSGGFTASAQVFTPVDKSAAAFADADLDGDLDLLHTGEAAGGRIAELYLNDGSGIFTLIGNMPFTGVGNGSVIFEDLDNDNRPDIIIISGESAGGLFTTKLYMNQSTIGVPETGSLPLLDVYPNPVNTRVLISGTWIAPLTYELLDQGGRLVKKGLIQDQTIPVQGVNPGFYFLRLITEDQLVMNKRIMINGN